MKSKEKLYIGESILRPAMKGFNLLFGLLSLQAKRRQMESEMEAAKIKDSLYKLDSFHFIEFCAVKKYPEAKEDLSKICPCSKCAGERVHGHFRCMLHEDDKPKY